MKSDLAETKNSLADDEASSQSMRGDLENMHALLFRFLGNGFRLALCNVGKLATQNFVVLVPDPIVFAPWSVVLLTARQALCHLSTHISQRYPPRAGS